MGRYADILKTRQSPALDTFGCHYIFSGKKDPECQFPKRH
jgi:hypothetical protein